ncbi:MAG: hypothetical protein O6934_03090, partial [SAR324 cluster bacterium]|nr:hypothetical protein [SAR324 cluster bacterium]
MGRCIGHVKEERVHQQAVTGSMMMTVTAWPFTVAAESFFRMNVIASWRLGTSNSISTSLPACTSAQRLRSRGTMVMETAILRSQRSSSISSSSFASSRNSIFTLPSACTIFSRNPE